MINCKIYVGNAQCTAGSTCITNRIQEVRACGIHRPKRWRPPPSQTPPLPTGYCSEFYHPNTILLSREIIKQMDSDWKFVYNSNKSKTTSMSKLSQLLLTGWINHDVIIQWDTVNPFSQSCVTCHTYLHGGLSSFSFRWGYCCLKQNQNSFYQKEAGIHKQLEASTIQFTYALIWDCLSNEWYSHGMEYSLCNCL